MKGLDSKNHYELLGVSPEATRAKIRERYREIALVYHPDSNFYNEIIDDASDHDQMQMFKVITEAYNTLMDEKKRAEYDRKFVTRLKKWEEEAGWRNETFTQKEGSSSHAYGIFGSTTAASAFSSQSNYRAKSVSEVIKSRKSLGAKLRSFLGFRY